MSCYKPLKAYRVNGGVAFAELGRNDNLGSLELPCGRCIGCRMRRASDWTLRVMHEASLYERNCFVTLTYAPGKLPPNGSLEHRDYQLFMKRLRKQAKHEVRFYMCGEYGPKTMRPHYHACLFNVDFDDRKESGKSKSGNVFYSSERLSELWPHGFSTVQDLTRETASYCARYIMKKQLGREADRALDYVDDDGVIHERKPEYAAMSLKPGIGARWFDLYARDVLPRDYAVDNGSRKQVPKYYDRLAKRKDIDTDDVAYKRELKARKRAADNTDERRAVREVVHEAKVSTLTRGDL